MSDNDLYPPQHTDPLLIVISGPSGVGKDSVIKAMKQRDLPFHFVVTATSRSPRQNEQHGVDYFFISQEEFIQMIEADELLEHAIVYGDYKGIPKEQVRQALASGKDVVMRIDVQGAATIRDISPEALLIFLTTQNEAEMIERLKLRKTETTDGLQNRIAIAREELKRKSEFDYIVVNRDNHLEEAVNTILAIIRAEHHRTTPKKVTL
ncbi:MAG: guanylate kinase [Chloroflexota bacterium]|nr:MAG: guanylate kinase [Chloroflexota bacterium]